MNKLLATSFSLLAINAAGVAGFFGAGQALAMDADDDVGVFGSVTVARLARAAAKSMANKDYPTAVTQYRQAIAQKGDFPLFYYGLLYCAMQTGNLWQDAQTALDGIDAKDNTAKSHLNYEYGHVYSMNNRWDEAIPLLKTALTKANVDYNFLPTKIRELQAKTEEKAPALVAGTIGPDGKLIPVYKEPEKFVVPTREMHGADEFNRDTKDVGADYENAFLASEWIGICEYKGFEKKNDVGFYNPPTANYQRVECLKGPPLASALPVHFKFYDLAGTKMPAGWKFGEDKMPAKGSKWIIFIPNAVPTGGAFDTYKGNYGRQEATEENVGEIRRIIEHHKGQI